MKHWPLHKAYFWETAPFFRILIPVVAGIIFYYNSSRKMQLPNVLYFFLAIILISFLVLVAAQWKWKTSRNIRLVQFLGFNIFMLFSSWSLCWFNDIRNDPSWFGKQVKEGADMFYLAQVIDAPTEKEKTWKLPLEILGSKEGEKINALNGRGLLYAYKDGLKPPFAKGDTIIIPGNWQAISNPGNPFEFDYATYCAHNNLYYRQFLPLSKIIHYSKGSEANYGLIERAHNWCTQQLNQYISDALCRGLIQAMLLGDETDLDGVLRSAYTETGIVHIIAISGSNVAFFFVLISALLLWLRNKKYRWIKYLLALPLIWFYVIMAGAAPSAVRAAIMFSILSIGFASRKNSNSLNQLFATALIVLLAEPTWLFSLGFQLSFIAVLSLILFYKPLYQLYKPTNNILKALWSVVTASLAAEILIAPIIIYYFHLLPLLFIVANIIAYIFMSIVLVLAMLVIVLSFIPYLALALGTITAFFVQHFNELIYWLQDLNPASFHFLRLSFPELMIIYIAIGGIAIFLINEIKRGLFISLSATCILVFFLCINEWHALNQKRIVVYSVGNKSYSELIQGKYYAVLSTDSSADQSKAEYLTKPAHAMWMAWKIKDIPGKELFVINGKKVLLLNTSVSTTDQFPVDYLVLNLPLKSLDPSKTIAIFSPKTIVIGNNNPWLTAKWSSVCAESNISLHLLKSGGSFQLE